MQGGANSASYAGNTSVYDGYGSLRGSRDDTSGVSGLSHAAVGFGGQWGGYTDVDPGSAAFGTGLVLLTHRYYDPGVGRFLNRDPIGYGGGINLYGFAGDNPINDADPSGYNAIIMYGGDKKNGTWKKIATSFANMYNRDAQRRKTGQSAFLFGLDQGAAKTFDKALATVSDIDTIIYVGHGGIVHTGSSVLYLNANDNLSAADVYGSSTKNVKSGAFIFLDACSTACYFDEETGRSINMGEESVAQAFANHFDTNILAFDQHEGPGPTPHWGWTQAPTEFGNFLGTQYFHDGLEDVHPTTVYRRIKPGNYHLR